MRIACPVVFYTVLFVILRRIRWKSLQRKNLIVVNVAIAAIIVDQDLVSSGMDYGQRDESEMTTLPERRKIWSYRGNAHTGLPHQEEYLQVYPTCVSVHPACSVSLEQGE